MRRGKEERKGKEGRKKGEFSVEGSESMLNASYLKLCCMHLQDLKDP